MRLDLLLLVDLVDLGEGVGRPCASWSAGASSRRAGVIWTARPNCTVSLIATSNEMMRPVILSRPSKTGDWIADLVGAAPRLGAVSAATAASAAPASAGLIRAMAGQARPSIALEPGGRVSWRALCCSTAAE